MKIAVVNWLINDVGGINSWTENFILGLRGNGHTVQHFYSTHQSRLNCDPSKKVFRSPRFHLLPGLHLSYLAPYLKATVAELNKFDLIVFAHPSPHPTRATTSDSWERNWQSLYTETTPPKITVFHDRHWDKSNTWIWEVRAHIDYAHAAQYHFLPAVEKFATEDKISHGWSTFPLRVPPLATAPKVLRFVWGTQWLSIKNHRHLVPRLMELELPVASYGSGQMYYKLLPTIQKVYRTNNYPGASPVACNPKSIHVNYGHVEYGELLKQMARAWFSLDLSIQGMTNMTHWEPLTVGTISVMERRVAEDAHCKIPDDCRMIFDLDTVVEDLNCIGDTDLKQLQAMRRRAYDFVQGSECRKIAALVLEKAGVA